MYAPKHAITNKVMAYDSATVFSVIIINYHPLVFYQACKEYLAVALFP